MQHIVEVGGSGRLWRPHAAPDSRRRNDHFPVGLASPLSLRTSVTVCSSKAQADLIGRIGTRRGHIKHRDRRMTRVAQMLCRAA